MSINYNILSKYKILAKLIIKTKTIVSVGNKESPPEDYCALICRDPNKLCLLNVQQDVVEVIQRCLEIFQLDFDAESKGVFHL